MKANTRVGEVAIHAEIDGEGRSYLLRPSFFAISQLSDPEWHFSKARFAVAVYRYGYDYCLTNEIDHGTLAACIRIIEACCAYDIPDCLLGYFKLNKREDKLLYRAGGMSKENIARLAYHLIYYGMVGKPSELWLRVPRKKSKPTPFDVSEYVGKAMSALKMNKSDAWDLTMVEFQRAMEQEYPIDESKIPLSQDEAEEAAQQAREALKRRKELNLKPRTGKLSDISRAVRGERGNNG